MRPRLRELVFIMCILALGGCARACGGEELPGEGMAHYRAPVVAGADGQIFDARRRLRGAVPPGQGWSCFEERNAPDPCCDQIVLVCDRTQPRWMRLLAVDESVADADVKSLPELLVELRRRDRARLKDARFESARPIERRPHDGFADALQGNDPEHGAVHLRRRLFAVGRHVIVLSATTEAEAPADDVAIADAWLDGVRVRSLD